MAPNAERKLRRIQSLVRGRRYRFYRHAIYEADKEGIAPEQVREALLSGELLEDYPERSRCLVLGRLADGLPLHVICDYSEPAFAWIVTVYIPQRPEWIDERRRRP